MVEITTTLQEWVVAERTGDVRALGSLLTDDFVGVGPLGFSHPIPEAVRASIALVEDSGRWRLDGVHFSFIAGTPGAPPIPAGSGT